MRIWLLLTLSSSAWAGASVHLFQVVKPVNPQNVIQVDALLPVACDLGDLDFYYLMNGTKPKRSMIEGSIRKMIPAGPAKPDQRTACRTSQGENCHALSVKLPFLDRVKHNLKEPDLLVKAVKKGNVCTVGAYLDLGKKVVQVKKVTARGERESLNIFNQSAKIRVDSVTIEDATGGTTTWACSENCETTLHL